MDGAKKIVVSYEIKYNYYIKNGSITNSPFELRLFDLIDANIQRYDYIKTKYPEIEPLYRKALLKAIIRVLFYIEKSRSGNLYQKEIQKLVDIYSCELPMEWVKVLDLFTDSTRKGFLVTKLYTQNTTL